MSRRLLITATVLGAIALTPGAASAATLTNDAGVLTYAGGAGGASNIALESFPPGSDTVFVTRFGDDTDPIAPAGCTEIAAGFQYQCDGVSRVVADAGDGGDVVSGFLLTVPIALNGGAGDDNLNGGSADDAIDGGPGDDRMIGNGGADDLHGGSGIDEVDAPKEADPAPPIDVTLDDRADDGTPGEGDNVHADVEDVIGPSTGFTDPRPLARSGSSAARRQRPQRHGRQRRSGRRARARRPQRRRAGRPDHEPRRVRGPRALRRRRRHRDRRGPRHGLAVVRERRRRRRSGPRRARAARPAGAPGDPGAGRSRDAAAEPQRHSGPRSHRAFRFRASGALSGVAEAAGTPGRVTIRAYGGHEDGGRPRGRAEGQLHVLGAARRLPALKVTATFAGDTVLNPATSRTRTVRIR